jgi:hypothetical protein
LGKISIRQLADSIFPKNLAFAQLQKKDCLSVLIIQAIFNGKVNVHFNAYQSFLMNSSTCQIQFLVNRYINS